MCFERFSTNRIDRPCIKGSRQGRHRQEQALLMELLHRYNGLKQRMIAGRLGSLEVWSAAIAERSGKRSRLNRRSERRCRDLTRRSS
jgi:hypothetical protein